MARIVYTLGELKGSVGGLTFQQNSSGKIVRQRPQISRTSSIKQQASHQVHQLLLQGYQALSGAEKDLWNTYASVHVKVNKFGEDKTLTGQNWYESINYQRVLRALVNFNVPPVHTIPANSPTFEILISPSAISINILQSYDFASGELNVWTTIPTTRQKPSINQIRKYVGIITGASLNPLNITNEWKAAVGLDWNPLVQFPKSNIFVCLESVSTVSYITSPLLCNKININDEFTESDSFYYYAST